MNQQAQKETSASVCVLGGRGMLGTDLARLLRSRGYRVIARDLPECDITREQHLEKALSDAGVVVNCAAFTDVAGAEDARETAMSVNAAAVGALGRMAAERGIFVVHISTDYVFDGSSDRPYVETDPPRPLNVSGDSKLKGEKALESSGCRCAIMRVQWSYGRAGTNFIVKLLKRARDGGDLKVVDDQVGAPTWTKDMARAVECLVRGRQTGLFHFANDGFASRFEVASFVLRELNLPNRLDPCSSSEFPTKAVRPLNSRLDTSRIRAALDHPIRHWQDALREFLRDRRADSPR